MRSSRARRLCLSLVCYAAVLGGCGEPGGQNGLDEAAVEANNRGVGLMGRFDYEAAREIFRELSERYPQRADIKTNLAIALLNRQLDGDEERALEIFQAVLAAEPGNDRARYCAGLLEYRRGELPGAVQQFRAVLDADPGDAYAAYFLAQALQQQGDREGALQWYRRSLEADPYLRSAYYALSRLYREQGDSAAAAASIERYQRFANNPRAQLVEFKYTRMGPKCEAATIGTPPAGGEPPPAGALFAEAVRLDITLHAEADRDAPPNLTVADINADGYMDAFLAGRGAAAGESNLVLLGRADGGFRPARDHPLAGVPAVNAALWGDYDNDGLTDVYLCRKGENRLLRHAGEGAWQDVTAAAGTGNGAFDSLDGAFLDADHDGDLDIFVVNRDGTNELLNNNLDGSFRGIAAERGLDGGAAPSKAVLLLDIDNDRDTDIITLNEQAPHAVYANNLMWDYRPATGFDRFLQAGIRAAASADRDGDGLPELYALDGAGGIVRWQADDTGSWQATRLGTLDTGPGAQLELRDLDGDGAEELLVTGTVEGWGVFALADDSLKAIHTADPGSAPPAASASIIVDAGRGPSLIMLQQDGSLVLHGPGTGRRPFVGLTVSGMDDGAGTLRSNASGIGTRLALRSGRRWILTDTFRHRSAPGQGLQPVVAGLNGAARLDFVALTWTDGVFQTELGLESGQLHHITETQRQLSSCPVLFAWDGRHYAFVSDLLGVGGLGYLLEPGVYAPPRPRENFLLPAGLPVPREGRYVLKIGEPMEEAAYLDAARLLAYDLPPGWDMVLDERMNVAGPEPTGEAVFYRSARLPALVTDPNGTDVTESVTAADRRAAPAGALDPRFIGRLREPQVLTLQFDAPINGTAAAPAVLVIDGWIEYPYSQTMFAAWQAHAVYRAPTLEARGADGQWRIVLEEFGYPAGMPRRMSVPLDGLPEATTALRLTTNQEIYWDRIAVVYAEPPPAVRPVQLPLERAQLLETGFARRSTGNQRQPHYDYDRRSPLWDTRHMRGYYTQFGPVGELLEAVDDAVAIIGPGEEIHLEFAADLPALPPGWQRRLVLETNGWAKDMDLYTADGMTVGPLPVSGKPAQRRDALHQKYNTRYR
ncbi:MAG: FG-GAP-like repeat-containing protein [Gammaproteobacteria bacterium]|jgi:tetratricopeptide (TPR) repeat protein